ncbi:TetR/AcrR family transcriptional regulator [Acidaminococcus fermentans]|uniref:TetR/AcrR family transcriptional regulator n=1 Tax=Acidaminococcus fermentans TaxID=905 RepID=UPI00307BCF9D
MVKINASLSKEKRILKAAEQVFSHKGYTQATLDEIIQIADTGKGTVYKYYKNKENLFYTLVEAKNRKLMKAMETAVEEGETFPISSGAMWKRSCIFWRRMRPCGR